MIKNVRDMYHEYEEYRGHTSKICSIIDNNIVINARDEYIISLDQCSTPEAILKWVNHLLEKKWITIPIIDEFIRLSTTYHDIHLHPLPG